VSHVIHYWWNSGDQFWLFTIYDNDETDDLTVQQRRILKELVKQSPDTVERLAAI